MCDSAFCASFVGMLLFSLRPALVVFIVAILGLGCTRTPTEAHTEAPERTVNALRAAYAAFNRNDIDGAVEFCDAQIEWSEPAQFPGGGVYHGRDAVKTYLAQSRAAWAGVISEPERFIIAGHRVVVFVHARVRPKDSSEWQDVRLADVYTFREGKAVAMRAFADRQEALRWVGVQDPNR